MKWKLFFFTCFAIFFITSTAQAETPISIVINGKTVETDVAPFIQNGTTYVPLRTIEQIEGISIKSWNNNNKTVVISNNNQQLTLSVNQSHAESLQIKDGRVMVPIRFIAEKFNSDVVWNTHTKTVHVAKVNDDTKANLDSTDLTKARVAAINIPKISSLQVLLSGESSSGYLQLFFPEGKSNAFFTIENGIIDYYVVRSNAAWHTWSGELGGNHNKISFLTNTGISSEVGKRPIIKDRLFFYKISTHSGQSSYGYISTDENEMILGSKDMDNLDDLYPIEGEAKAD